MKKDVYTNGRDTKETGKCPHILPGFDPTWSCYSPIVLLLLDTMDTWDNAKLQIIQKLPQKLSACKIPLISSGLLTVFLGAITYGGFLGTRVSSIESYAKWKAKCLSKEQVEENGKCNLKEQEAAAGRMNGVSGRDLFVTTGVYGDDAYSDDEGPADDEEQDLDLNKHRQETEAERTQLEEERITHLGGISVGVCGLQIGQINFS
ncbi:hypothetical protein MJO29_014858 [Puccinia striiformis f. sp. tritici]|nr:hypothetical protein MJO29_014858 [Puccinia striiformis f. sp. tritici]